MPPGTVISEICLLKDGSLCIGTSGNNLLILDDDLQTKTSFHLNQNTAIKSIIELKDQKKLLVQNSNGFHFVARPDLENNPEVEDVSYYLGNSKIEMQYSPNLNSVLFAKDKNICALNCTNLQITIMLRNSSFYCFIPTNDCRVIVNLKREGISTYCSYSSEKLMLDKGSNLLSWNFFSGNLQLFDYKSNDKFYYRRKDSKFEGMKRVFLSGEEYYIGYERNAVFTWKIPSN